jgi:hypothetical protein
MTIGEDAAAGRPAYTRARGAAVLRDGRLVMTVTMADPK